MGLKGDFSNKSHIFDLYHPQHLGNSEGFKSSVTRMRMKTKYTFLTINHKITIEYIPNSISTCNQYNVIKKAFLSFFIPKSLKSGVQFIFRAQLNWTSCISWQFIWEMIAQSWSEGRVKEKGEKCIIKLSVPTGSMMFTSWHLLRNLAKYA